MKTKIHILLCILSLTLSGLAQNGQSPFRVWQLMTYSGELNFRGSYGQNISKNEFGQSKQSGTYFAGGVNVRTLSYFVHPNFMEVNVNAVFNPETKRNYAVGMPQYSEKTQTEAVDYTVRFLKKKNFNLTTTGGFNNGNTNIENISRVKYKGKFFGGSFSSPNKILPFLISYQKEFSEQKIIESDRLFKMDMAVLMANVHKAFSKYDNSSLDYQHTEYNSSERDYLNSSYTKARIKFDQLNFNNGINFFLDKQKNYNYNSSISSTNARGDVLINSINVNEMLNMKLPKKFNWTNAYNFSVTQQNLYRTGINKIYGQSFQTSLRHQLYTSLATQINYGYSQNKQNIYYNQTRNTFGGNITYNKRIPTGSLLMMYGYGKEFQSINSPDMILNVVHESYRLSDTTITLLNNQNVNMQSIVVKDVTGAITYTLGTDYLLIDKNPFVEIVRVPGGLIPQNGTVYIDYTSVKSGSFKYTGDNHMFSASVSLFKNILTLSYTFSKQNFYNVSKSDVQKLNYYIRHVATVRVDFVYLKAGIQYDYNRSTVTPYQGMNYYVLFQKSLKKFSIVANGNVSDMQMTDEKSRRLNIDLSSKIAYTITKNLTSSFEYSYRTMQGRGLNIHVQVAKLYVTATIRKLYFNVGSDFYFSKNYKNQGMYNGVYVQLIRKF